ncbi:MAG TPA: substrate-binding domain-containing protein [Caldilineaceae bacterium]|nr:substrate-binding domain-containing protein [Caldilineaceae bacterium]
MSQPQRVLSKANLSRRSFLKGAAAIGLGAPLFAACTVPTAPTTTTGQEGAAAPATEVKVVEFWDMVWGPPEYVDTGNKLVAQFNEEHTDMQAIYQSTPWTNWYQTFLTAIGSGTAPDCSTGAGYQAVQFYAQGAVVPVDHIIDEWRAEGEVEDFLPGTIERLQYDGHFMALPWQIDIRIPWIRTDYLEETGLPMPSNWTELDAVLEAMTGGDRYGIVAPNDTGGSHYIFMLMFNNDGGLFTEDLQLDVMYERNVEALQYAANWVAQGWMHPGSAGFVGDDAIRAFGQGFAGVQVNNPNYPARLAPEVAEVTAPMDVLESPHGTVGTISWVNNMMLYAQADDLEAASYFLKWWSKNQLPLWTEGHMTQVPVRKSFAADPFFQENANLVKVLNEWVPIGKGTAERGEGIFPELNEVEGEGVMQTLWQDILQGKDVMESLRTAEARLQSIVG